ncbi:MAG: hypothetical protein FWG36_03810 [Oscillospiraceae bacterium]|nr:hypothetical protein [Oscillospiraceae bacterium]
MIINYKTREGREETALELYRRAKDSRSEREREWTKLSDYYEGKRRTAFMENMGFTPAVCTDVYMHVETQIDTKVPEYKFVIPGGEYAEQAELRRRAVVYILENNKLESQNSRNERRLLKYGSAFWKCFYDSDVGGGAGDIRIIDVPIESLFPDPTNKSSDIELCEYVDYVYYINKRKAVRLYGEALRKIGLSLDELDSSLGDTDVFAALGAVESEDTIRVLEHWYRDDEGDIACSILLGEVEVRHIPKYWENTRNNSYPFIHYWRIADENNFWQRSEIAPILELVDAVDRELAIAMYNDALTSNDMFLVEEDALAEGQEITNIPGAVLKVKAGQSGRIQRLLGAHTGINCMPMIAALQEQISRTIGSFDVTRGDEPERNMSAAGIERLNERADLRRDLKQSDRLDGFKRLYKLCDWSALEFYDDGRVIPYNDGSFCFDPSHHVIENGEYPAVDVI